MLEQVVPYVALAGGFLSFGLGTYLVARAGRSPQAFVLGAILWFRGILGWNDFLSLSNSWGPGGVKATTGVEYYALLATSCLLLLWATIYPQAPKRRLAMGAAVAAAAFAALSAAYLARPDWLLSVDSAQFGQTTRWFATDFGPLAAVYVLVPLAAAVASVRLAHEAVTETEPILRRVEAIVAAAFLLDLGARAGSRHWWLDPGTWNSTTSQILGASAWTQTGAMLVLTGGLAWASKRPKTRDVARTLAVALWSAFMLVVVAERLDSSGDWGRFAAALVGLAFPVLTAYAVLRTQMFDIDLRLRGSLQRGATAAPFAATIFIVSEALETRLPDGNLAVGIAGAACLALAFRPIHKGALRLVDRMLPHWEEHGHASDHEDIYRDQYLLAAHDGAIRPRERAMLNQLADLLDIAPDRRRSLEALAKLPPQPS